MTAARRATPEDADELVRLRAVMLAGVTHVEPTDDGWRAAAREILRSELLGDRMAAFVVSRPDESGLTSCAVGTIEQRLPSPGNPTGRSGYVFSVATDPLFRRQGHSRACMTALLAWFRSNQISRVDLRASTDGFPLYSSLGFRPTGDPAMRLTL
jgi:GNAT superfamily N-acetyltransferase